MSMGYEPCCDYGYGGYGGGMSGYGNIFSLIILILIVCKFCKKDKDCDHDDHCGVDNSILFIIAIFVLVFCSCGKGLFGGGRY